ncbi:hypothetical protein [Streptomyces sp. NPDC057877]|uniref:hypothetical protein n=1 Tax=Streptomyces sp. NPDC057877 TaxID=3346269 RepID=UPI00367CA950
MASAALVTPLISTSPSWRADRRTQGGRLAAPAPHCRCGDLCWLLPPGGSGPLDSPAVLDLVLRQAVRELARAHRGPHAPSPPAAGTRTPPHPRRAARPGSPRP